MLIDNYLAYLKTKIPNFKTTNKGKLRVTCLNIDSHKFKSEIPTAEYVESSDKFCCYLCGSKLSVVEFVRKIESDKAGWSEEQIKDYLSTNDKQEYPEFEQYKKYNWSLTKAAKNARNPFCDGWQTSQNYNPLDWKRWINQGYNVTVVCGEVSNLTVFDFDLYKIKEHTPDTQKLFELLEATQTLMERSRSGGRHYFFKFDKDFKNDQFPDLKMEIKTTGGGITIQPSIVDGKKYEFINLGAEIKPLSKELKDFILNYKPPKPEITKNAEPQVEGVKVYQDGDGRNNLITSLGGLFINRFSPDDTDFIMQVINNKFFNPRLSPSEIKATLGSLSGYKENEHKSQAEKIYDYLREMKEVSPIDVKDSLQLARNIVDKWLNVFVKKGKAIRLGKGRGVRYQYKEKIEWADDFESQKSIPIQYRVPYFYDIHRFAEGDLIILGGKPGAGKTTTCMNIIKLLVAQGIKPYYITTESGSRSGDTAEQVGLKKGDFFLPPTKKEEVETINPSNIELEPHSFTIIDWLDIQDFSETHITMKHLNDNLKKVGGILLIFTQLRKEDYSYFAKDLIDFYASFSARYIFDDRASGLGHWLIDKMRQPVVEFNDYYNVPMQFDKKTLLLTKREE